MSPIILNKKQKNWIIKNSIKTNHYYVNKKDLASFHVSLIDENYKYVKKETNNVLFTRDVGIKYRDAKGNYHNLYVILKDNRINYGIIKDKYYEIIKGIPVMASINGQSISDKDYLFEIPLYIININNVMDKLVNNAIYGNNTLIFNY